MVSHQTQTAAAVVGSKIHNNASHNDGLLAGWLDKWMDAWTTELKKICVRRVLYVSCLKNVFYHFKSKKNNNNDNQCIIYILNTKHHEMALALWYS